MLYYFSCRYGQPEKRIRLRYTGHFGGVDVMDEIKTSRFLLDRILEDLGLDKRQVPAVWYQAAEHVLGPDADPQLDPASDQSRMFLSVLEPDRLLEYGGWIGLDETCIAELIRAAEIIKIHQQSSLFLQINAWSLFCSGLKPGEDAFRVPEMPKTLDHLAGLFPVLALLAGIPGMVAIYDKHQIPQTILEATLGDVKIWMDDYRRINARPGLSSFWWHHLHLSGAIFRIGRLQFAHTHFSGSLKAYRNQATGQVCALSLSGITYRSDGQVDGTNGIFDRRTAWTASLKETERQVVGSPICARGDAVKPELTLSFDRWQPVLEPGNGVLDVHIPEDGRLDHEACGRSIRDAIVFFRTHFPNLEIKALVCTSWILDPQLQTILDSSANLCRFQRELYLYPIRSDDRQTFERVFHSTPDEIRRLQADTSLQKAIIKHVKAGNRMHAGGMFLLVDDAEAWGSHDGPAYQDCDMNRQNEQDSAAKMT